MKTLLLSLFILTCFSPAFAQQKEIIKTDKAPAAIGPYSQAVKANGFLFLAGQLGINPDTGELENESFEAEVRQALENINAILEASGSSMEQIVNTTVYLTDLSQFAVFNEIYGSYFEGQYPARTTIGSFALPKNAAIEIAVFALDSDR
ncbi:RidA family protein [Jiulongibacter sp. NS-SX5]|uniref:RidA family protein n=1 Tax=Jiulongibacter sp. NS-SX5 TaxID=3463854 RepID=UPI004059398E